MKWHLRKILLLPCLLTLLGLATPSADAAIVLNNLLADWGVTVGDNNSSSYAGMTNSPTGSIPPLTLSVTTGGGQTLYYHLEDQNDSAGLSGFLDPNHGGQRYDAEFLGVVHSATTITVVIVSGQRPDNTLWNYSPGDIIVQTSNGTYGIEVGGADGSTVVGANDAGVAFALLQNSGHTTGYTVHNDQKAGSIWKNPEWLEDPINPVSDVQIKHGTGTSFGTATDFINTFNSVTSQHSIIALSFDASGMGDVMSLTWSPSCGNDVLHVNLPNPEPASLAIWGGIGLCVFGARYRRRRKS